MQFRVLGSLEVLNDAGDVAGVGGTTQRRLLAVLLVDAGSVVSVDRLCDVLAVSEPALRTAVSRLRRAIGDTHLVTEPPGYRLVATAIDAARFRELCRDARHAPPDRAVDLLDEALALWRGDAYAEFADRTGSAPMPCGWASKRADALEDRAETLIELGRYGEAVARLERRADQPLRDRPRALAMRALAAQGRQAEALRAYQDHCHYLADELGTEPSMELVELERRIARGWHDSAGRADAHQRRPNGDRHVPVHRHRRLDAAVGPPRRAHGDRVARRTTRSSGRRSTHTTATCSTPGRRLRRRVLPTGRRHGGRGRHPAGARP